MKKPLSAILFMILLISCADEQLTFTQKTFQKQLTLPNAKDTTTVEVDIPVADGKTIVADSINNKIFSVVKEIIYLENESFTSKDYNLLLKSFIGSYQQFVHDFPDYTTPWDANVKGKITYQTAAVLNIEIDHYSFTGGAHGNGGLRSIIIDPKTGKTIPNDSLFKNKKEFKAFAEKQFRTKYKIPANNPINSTGLQFENEKFQLPQNIFYTDKGLLLYYNQYEVASYVDGPKELLLPYTEVDPFLNFK